MIGRKKRFKNSSILLIPKTQDPSLDGRKQRMVFSLVSLVWISLKEGRQRQ